jgi:hypothetical protein
MSKDITVKKLTNQQREFAYALAENGWNSAKAALACGFNLRDPRHLNKIKDWSEDEQLIAFSNFAHYQLNEQVNISRTNALRMFARLARVTELHGAYNTTFKCYEAMCKLQGLFDSKSKSRVPFVNELDFTVDEPDIEQDLILTDELPYYREGG